MNLITLLLDILESIPVTPNTLRLLIVLAFGYAAVLDYRTRRVYNEFWIPLIGLCFIVLAWDTALLAMQGTVVTTNYLYSMGMSVLIVPSVAFTLWQANVIGGADLKALAFLAVFFPKIPEFTVYGVQFPVTPSMTPIFTVTILLNALIVGVFYRGIITIRNVVNSEFSRRMTRAVKYDTDVLVDKHGDLIDCPDGPTLNYIDIDTLRMYLQWRGVSLEKLNEETEFHKSTGPAVEQEVGDGSLPTAENTPLGHSTAEFNPPMIDDASNIIPKRAADERSADPWATEQFIEMVDQTEYCVDASPMELRIALETITSNDEVWVSPAVPFFIPLTVGLIIAVTYGSLFVGGTEWIADLLVSVFF